MIAGDKVVLRAWREADLDLLTALRNDAILQAQLMTQPRPSSTERVKHWLMQKSDQVDCAFFVVASAFNDIAVGYVQVANLNPLHRTGEFGICLAPSAQRMGYGSDAFVLLESYVKSTFACRKLFVHILASNDGALAFHRKCGFEEAGCLRRHVYLNSDFHDVVIMEKLVAP